MLLRLRVACRKELTQFFRSKPLVFLVLYMFAEVANCAAALSLDVRNLPLLVVDRDDSAASRALGERFRIAPYFNYRRAEGTVDPEAALELGTAPLVLVIPPSFSRALGRGEPTQVQLLADGTYSNISQLALGYANEIIHDYSATVRAVWEMRSGAPGLPPPIVERVRIWYLPGLEYSQAQMMSMISISALVLGVLLPATAIVREKEAGTIEQLLVSPLRPWEIIAAKLLPMGLLMVVGLAIGLLEGRLLFGMPIRGSLWLYFGLSLVLFFAAMGLGTLIGAAVRNLQQTLLLTFALLFPMLFLSGTVVPLDNMPPAMWWLTFLSPLRYYLPIAEGILLKGVGLDVVAANALALGLYGLALMTIGVRQLRRTLAG